MLLLAEFDWNHFWDITLPILVALGLKTFWDIKNSMSQNKKQQESLDSTKAISDKQDKSMKADKIIADKADIAAKKANEAATNSARVVAHTTYTQAELEENTQITQDMAKDVAVVKEQTNGTMIESLNRLRDDLIGHMDQSARKITDRVDMMETRVQNLTERVDVICKPPASKKTEVKP